MSLPSEHVELIFSKLALAYGHRFLSIWDGLPMEDVKADWAHELDGLPIEALSYALQNLPAGRPPDVMQFREICRRRPDGLRQKALPHVAPATGVPEFVRKQLAAMRQEQREGAPRTKWAHDFVVRFGKQGQQLTWRQREDLEFARRLIEREKAAAAFEANRIEAQRKTDEALAQGGGNAQ